MKIDSIKIKLILAGRGMTQADLAEKCGIYRQHISCLLTRGTCAPKIVNKISKALGVDAREIIKEE